MPISQHFRYLPRLGRLKTGDYAEERSIFWETLFDPPQAQPYNLSVLAALSLAADSLVVASRND